MSQFRFIQRTVQAAITFHKVVQAVQAVLPPEVKKKEHEVLNKTAAKPLFDGFHEESKYFPVDFQNTSLTITMLIKDQEADNEIMERFRSGKLEEELNNIISQHKAEIKVKNLKIGKKKVIKTSKSFEKLEKEAQYTAYSNPIIASLSPLKVSWKGLGQISGKKRVNYSTF